jgi:hypothetical protein
VTVEATGSYQKSRGDVVCVLLLLESTQFVWETGRLEENEPSSGHPHGLHKQGLKPP